MKTIFPVFLILVLVFGFSAPALAKPALSHTNRFGDVSDDNWAFPAIDELVKRNVISGYADGTFKPAGAVSRAEFAKMLVLAYSLPAGTPVTSSYDDVAPSHWAFTYVEAVGSFMMRSEDPGSKQFQPNAPCKREVAAAAIASVVGYNVAEATPEILERFVDRASITPNLTSYVALAVQHDVLKGQPVGDGTSYVLRPQQPLTRAEAASLLYRLTLSTQDTSAGTPASAGGPTAGIELTTQEQALLDLMNVERARLHLSPLVVDPKLVELARMKSKDLVDHGVFSHDSPAYGAPRDMLKAAGVKTSFMGENLAGGSSAPETLMMWMESQGHRNNVLNPAFTHAGVGICAGPDDTITVVIFIKH